MIKIENLSKVFRSVDMETTAINNLTLEVNAGSFIAIMGPSGCGKSTLLNILGLLDNPSSGTYNFGSQEVSKFTEKQLTTLRKGGVGFIFQNFNLIDELTVFENVALPLEYLKVSKSDRKKRVDDVLKRIGIDHRADHFPRQLSGGQQQRVAVARAIAFKPKFILADEPTGNLDSKNGREVMELLSELNKEGVTIIMVTHSKRDAKYANRKIFLHDGQIVEKLIEEDV